jgi:hypothetical protein
MTSGSPDTTSDLQFFTNIFLQKKYTYLVLNVGLDSSLYVSWFASEFCLSVTMLCCSMGFVMKIEQCINLKFLVKLKKKTDGMFPTVKGGVK